MCICVIAVKNRTGYMGCACRSVKITYFFFFSLRICTSSCIATNTATIAILDMLNTNVFARITKI